MSDQAGTSTDAAPPQADVTTPGIPAEAEAVPAVASNTEHYQHLVDAIATGHLRAGGLPIEEGSPHDVQDATPDGIPPTPPPAESTAPDLATLLAEVKDLRAAVANRNPAPAPLAAAARVSANPFELLAKHDLGETAEHASAFTIAEMSEKLSEVHGWTRWQAAPARTAEDKANAARHIGRLSHDLDRLKYEAERDASTAQIEARQNQVETALNPADTKASYASFLPGLFTSVDNMPLLAARHKAGLPLDMIMEGIDFTLSRGDEAGEKAIARQVYANALLIEKLLGSLAPPAPATQGTSRTVTPPNAAIMTPPPGTPVVSGEEIPPTTNADYWQRAAATITRKQSN